MIKLIDLFHSLLHNLVSRCNLLKNSFKAEVRYHEKLSRLRTVSFEDYRQFAHSYVIFLLLALGGSIELSVVHTFTFLSHFLYICTPCLTRSIIETLPYDPSCRSRWKAACLARPQFALASVPRTQMHINSEHARREREGARKSFIPVTRRFDWPSF